MTEDELEHFMLGMLVVCVIWLIFSLPIGSCCMDLGKNATIRDAVKNGAAIYVHDEYGQPVHEWVSSPEEAEE